MGLPNADEATFLNLVDQINECEFIFSSSLHGIIFAHSLGIPAVHIEVEELISKNNFKFKDYYSAIDLPYVKLTYSTDVNFDELFSRLEIDRLVPNKDVIVTKQAELMQALVRLCSYYGKTNTEPKLPTKQEPVKQQIKQKTTKTNNNKQKEASYYLYF